MKGYFPPISEVIAIKNIKSGLSFFLFLFSFLFLFLFIFHVSIFITLELELGVIGHTATLVTSDGIVITFDHET